ncbi:hypothetical protein Acr_06g0012120 [Actinidia rufa]|uniref:Uncharacterized protein n=1 Tax=Actinidia rufa TaxID=165716 RepID=A0A7J0ESF7_9ERIC|nr:hypothetical protein Acr_06g0012120 [Actinidia rufa]
MPANVENTPENPGPFLPSNCRVNSPRELFLVLDLSWICLNLEKKLILTGNCRSARSRTTAVVAGPMARPGDRSGSSDRRVVMVEGGL